MKHLRRYGLLLILIGLTISPTLAQKNIGNLFVKNKYKGDIYFLDYYYEEAIRYYKLALRNDPNKEYLRLKIADSYRLLGDHHNAFQYYEQVLDHNPDAGKPIHKLHFANALIAEGELEAARKWLELYGAEVPDDSRTTRKLSGIARISDYMVDSAVTNVENLALNSEFSDFGATTHTDGIVFLSARRKKGLIDQDYLREENLYDLYTANMDSLSGLGTVRSFDKILNTPYHEGPVTFYNGEPTRMIFTRSNYHDKRATRSVDGKTKLQLFNATRVGDLWANIQPFEIRDAGFSIAHPTLSASNDTLFFVSDMPGGYGGSDIYMSVLRETWTGPINLGPKVNTEGNELYPYYVEDRLFFSSDGHGGLGGLDVYKAALYEGRVEWVANVGNPVNTVDDDFSYSIDPESHSGYFASNRPGGYGSDDIYKHSYRSLILAGDVVETQTQEALEGVILSLLDGDSVIARAESDIMGAFRLQVPLDGEFQVLATKREYSFLSDVIVSSRGRILDMDTLHISMRKHDLFAQGIVYDEETQRPMHDAQVVITDLTTAEVDTVITDDSGLYSFVIFPQREYAIVASKNLFNPDSVGINTYSINKGVILNDMLLEEVNIDLEIVLFDYNKADIRPEFIPTMEISLGLMRQYPEAFLIIGAHADSRGTREYNLELSQRRADATVDFFVRNGIDRDRIIARAFGEGLILNRCVDGVNCREEDHSKNRRSEIRVELELPEEELEDQPDRRN